MAVFAKGVTIQKYFVRLSVSGCGLIVLYVVVTLLTLSPSPSQEVFNLTITPVPEFRVTPTNFDLQATRTSIALTRDPSLAVSATPGTIQLTATSIISQLTQATHDPNFFITATAVVAGATQTAIALTDNPSLALTVFPTDTPECRSVLANYYQADLSNRIQAALEEAGFRNTAVSGMNVGITEPGGCDTTFYTLSSHFHIVVAVETLSELSENELATLTANVLSVLVEFPPPQMYGSEPARLVISVQTFNQEWAIDTGYTNALKAYEEGLRGAELLEALGGISPLF